MSNSSANPILRRLIGNDGESDISLAAALAVVAGLAGLEGVDLAAVDLVDDARLGGMALKSFLLYGHAEQSSA